MKRVAFIATIILLTVTCYSQTMENGMEKATFGSGCFWCTEALFEQLNGVQSVTSGYSGGKTSDPTYEDICTGTTGHAEVIEIVFDTKIITFTTLLAVFWQTHDPTTLNQQGADVGTQYRSVIFYHSERQKTEAEFYKVKLDKQNIFLAPIVTEISPAVKFYSAETSHQDYYTRNGNAPYCRAVITPKVEKFKAVFGDKLK